MKKGATFQVLSFRSLEEEERIEQLIENLIRCVASAQVQTRTTEDALAISKRQINQLAARCDVLEKKQQDLLRKIASRSFD